MFIHLLIVICLSQNFINFADFVSYDSRIKYYNINYFISHQFPPIYNIQIYMIIDNETFLFLISTYLIYRRLTN